MKAPFLFALVLILSGISSACAGEHCDQCEDIPDLYRLLLAHQAALKHYQAQARAAAANGGHYTSGAQDGATDAAAESTGAVVIAPYSIDPTYSYCPIFKTRTNPDGTVARGPDGKSLTDLSSTSEMRADKRWCEEKNQIMAMHEESHRDDCLAAWHPDPRNPAPVEPPYMKDNDKLAEFQVKSEIKAHTDSINRLAKLIEQIAEKCITESSKCNRKCRSESGGSIAIENYDVQQMTTYTSCTRKCIDPAELAIIKWDVEMARAIRDEANSISLMLGKSTH